MYTYTIDYYEVLGLSPNATVTEIKAAYRRLAMRWHPDRHQGESESDIAYAEKMFKLVNEAYQALMNGGPTYAEQTCYEDSDYESGSQETYSEEGSYEYNSGYTYNDSGSSRRSRSGINIDVDWGWIFTDIINILMKVLKYVAIAAAVIFGGWLIIKLLLLVLHTLIPIFIVAAVIGLGYLGVRCFLL